MDAPLRATPALEGLLGTLRRRLRSRVWLHGAGTLALVLSLWLAFAFLADWGLRVPRAVRILHALVVLGLAGAFAWRGLVRPLRRVPPRSGLALLVERAHPDLRELLVSAVQFQAPAGSATSHGDPELVGRVLAAADGAVPRLELGSVLDDRGPRGRFLLGTVAALVLGVLAFANPHHTAIFVDRLLGGSAPWPQRTHLVLEIPDLGTGTQVERSAERIVARVARGTDVPVIVTAQGLVPDDVTLHFDGGRDLVLSTSKGGVFRTLLRSCQEDLAFHATGGDDRDGRPRVEIEVLQPPDVEGLAVRIVPPAYSGLVESIAYDRDVEVLAGSRVAVHVRPFPAEATGVVRLLPDDVAIDLEPAPFPAEASDGDAPGGLSFQFFAEKSIGYRIELTDDSGLSNPDPGLFRVRVVEDRPPEVQVLAPGRTEFEIVRGGAVPLRARAEDDFGLVGMRWIVQPAAAGDAGAGPALSGQFTLRAVGPEGETDARPEDRIELATHRRSASGGVRIEVDDLAEEVAVDQWYEFEIIAKDNRQPLAGEGRSLPVRARVVTPEELLRRMQSRLAQTRLGAIRLSDLQREKKSRVEELLSAIVGDTALDSGEGLALAAALNGQRRVQGDAQALARDLAEVVEDVLYARLDEKAGALLEFYDARAAEVFDLAFHAEPFRELARAVRAGQLGPSGFAGNLVDLVDLTLEISEEHAAAAAVALDRAQNALGAGEVQAALIGAEEAQAQALRRIDALLERLAEWDNFQNVLALTRDILNGQKALRERTQQFASEK